jgi:hypothetical protein
MEWNMEGVGGQIVESSDGKIVIKAPVKAGKEWQDWLQDFQLKSNSGWIVRNTPNACMKWKYASGKNECPNVI